MSVATFKEILVSLKELGIDRVELLGGEPTLNPHFVEFLDIVYSDNFFESLLVYSNGIFQDDKIRSKIKEIKQRLEITFLINYNNPGDIDALKSSIVEENIQFLKTSGIDVCLGYNLYKTDQDYSPVIRFASKYDVPIRWTLCVPNITRTYTQDEIKSHFKRFIPIVFSFLKDCIIQRVSADSNCNNIPLCLLTKEELLSYAIVGNAKVGHCGPSIIVLPNKQAIRCYMVRKTQYDLNGFSTERELKTMFRKNEDSKYRQELFEECKNCLYYELKKRSCGCLVFKTK